jgi:hypothetical protein
VNVLTATVTTLSGDLDTLTTDVNHAQFRIFNVLDYGADPIGATDCTTAFQNTIAAAKAVGGTVYVPPGVYQISDTLDLSMTVSTTHAISFIGGGMNQTILQWKWTTPNTYKPVIKVGNGARENTGYAANSTVLQNFMINSLDAGGARPAVKKAGQFGITSTDFGTGANTVIQNVAITGMRDCGVHIIGPTGPVLLENCSINACAGDYAVYLGEGIGWDGVADTRACPQNVTMRGGDIHDCLGGVGVMDAPGAPSGSAFTSLYSVDIELPTAAVNPAITIAPSSQNFYASGCTLTNLGNVVVGAIVLCQASGAVFEGCGTSCNGGVASLDNFLFDTVTCEHCTVIGGYHNNYGSGTSAYLIRVASATYIAAVAPCPNGGTYASGKAVMYVPAGAGAYCQSLCIPILP